MHINYFYLLIVNKVGVMTLVIWLSFTLFKLVDVNFNTRNVRFNFKLSEVLKFIYQKKKRKQEQTKSQRIIPERLVTK